MPYYAQRIHQHYGSQDRRGRTFLKGLTKTPVEYYKMFYNDTAIHGNTAALMLAYDFWGSGPYSSLVSICRWVTTMAD